MVNDKSHVLSMFEERTLFEITNVNVEGHSLMGLRAELPNLPPLVLIVGGKGFVMCGYLNLETAEKLGAAAAVVTGVKSVEDVLRADIRSVTQAAKELGINPGDSVRKILGKLA